MVMASKKSRKQMILDAAGDAARDFAVYRRKEDENLSIDDINEALERREIRLDEIVKAFRDNLTG